jgi:DNA polymerase III alpha subunit (gram-positive type)
MGSEAGDSEEEYRQAMKEMGIGAWWINRILEILELYRKGHDQKYLL